MPIEIAEDISKIVKGEEASIKKSKQAAVQKEKVEKKAEANEPKTSETPETQDTEVNVSAPKRSLAHAGNDEDYVVKKGDTLMKISFEKYGDVLKWRKIFDANKEKLGNFNRLTIGMTLLIEGVEYVVIEKNGKPYLIRKNDTLVKISKKVYGKPVYWRDLWKNNKQLIHDPNKIYAGFTLYYDENREKEASPLTQTKKSPERTVATLSQSKLSPDSKTRTKFQRPTELPAKSQSTPRSKSKLQ